MFRPFLLRWRIVELSRFNIFLSLELSIDIMINFILHFGVEEVELLHKTLHHCRCLTWFSRFRSWRSWDCSEFFCAFFFIDLIKGLSYFSLRKSIIEESCLRRFNLKVTVISHSSILRNRSHIIVTIKFNDMYVAQRLYWTVSFMYRFFVFQRHYKIYSIMIWEWWTLIVLM